MAKSLTGTKPLPPHKRAKRFLDVTRTFLAIYLSYKRIQRNKKLTPAQREVRLSKAHTKNAERIYGLATRLEGMLIKTCQFISSRADVAPTEYIAVLSRLQDSVPPRPLSQVEDVFQREFGKHPDQMFATFSREPIASASLAQVHRATTKDGRDAAVKVQYPGIDRILETDLRNIAILVKVLARIERNFDFRVLVKELHTNMPRELDFELEGRSSERVAKDLAHRADVRVPDVYWETTSRRILTTEFIDAVKISDIAGLEAQGIDPNEVAQIMTEAYCEQILVHGYFHADPHPGNLFVLPGPVVVFLDFGLSKELPEEFRLNYAKLIMALIKQDDAEMVAAFRTIGFKTKSEDPESLVALGKSFFDYGGVENKPYVDTDVMPEVNERMARILKANPVTEIPGDILLIFRVLGLMSGLQKRLDSNVDVMQTVSPYAEEQAQKLVEMTQGDAAG